MIERRRQLRRLTPGEQIDPPSWECEPLRQTVDADDGLTRCDRPCRRHRDRRSDEHQPRTTRCGTSECQEMISSTATGSISKLRVTLSVYTGTVDTTATAAWRRAPAAAYPTSGSGSFAWCARATAAAVGARGIRSTAIAMISERIGSRTYTARRGTADRRIASLAK